MDPLIRPALREDCEAISRIYNHYVVNGTNTFLVEPETLADRIGWFEQHGEGHPVFVAEQTGAVVGWASLSSWSTRCGYRHTVESSVYLDPEWRARGLGLALVEKLVEAARLLGHHTIIAGVSADQDPSLRLHLKMGFIEVARFREVGFKFGRWIDVVYLQRML